MKFSIIIPTYNRADFLANAIISVLNQSYENWELIIVDDGSTDNTKEIIKKFISQDSRIKYLYQNNSERSAARNNGINNSNGDYICFMDSDNLFKENRLYQLYDEIKNTREPAMFYTSIDYVKKGESIFLKKGIKFKNPVNKDVLIKQIIATPQLCISKSILEELIFNPKISVAEDLELIFRISEKYPIYYLDGDSTIIEIQHENRSVNYSNYSNIKQIDAFKLMFKKGHPASKVNWKLKRKKWSEVYLRACYYYCLNKSFFNAFKYIFQSVYMNPFDKFIFKMNIAFYILFRKNKINKLIM